MTLEKLINNASCVNFLIVQDYLKNSGWQRLKSKREHIAIFRKDSFEIILPLSRDFADYGKSIFYAAKIIGEAEKRDPSTILADFMLPPSDVVRFRISNNDTLNGTISLDEGFSLFESAKKALYAAACDEIQPELYHRRLGLKKADNFINKCRLGQTAQGSFVASIICPFTKDEDMESEENDQLKLFPVTQDDFATSLTRRVTSRFMKSLGYVKDAIENNELDKLQNPSTDFIVSANLMEAIIEMTTSKETSEIEIMTSWASVAPVSEKIDSVKISSDFFPYIEKIIEKITPTAAEEKRTFTGKISATKANPDPESRTEGEVTFNFIGDDDKKLLKAKVVLKKVDYNTAVQAHKDGAGVQITGKLVNSNRSKTIIEYSDFKVI